jgi:hypothetical protein
MLLSLKQFETKLVPLILRHHCRLKMRHRCRLTLVMRHCGILYGLRPQYHLTSQFQADSKDARVKPYPFLVHSRSHALATPLLSYNAASLPSSYISNAASCQLVAQCHTTTPVVSCCSFSEAVRDQSSHLDYTAHH